MAFFRCGQSRGVTAVKLKSNCGNGTYDLSAEIAAARVNYRALTAENFLLEVYSSSAGAGNVDGWPTGPVTYPSKTYDARTGEVKITGCYAATHPESSAEISARCHVNIWLIMI